MTVNFEHVFEEAFETFKVFKNIKVRNVGEQDIHRGTSTIWQILNHLVISQASQLKRLEEGQNAFVEEESWIEEKEPGDQELLDHVIEVFDSQLRLLSREVCQLDIVDDLFEDKLRILVEAGNHLSFHLGEIIQLRRSLGEYPLPGQMKEFLNS